MVLYFAIIICPGKIGFNKVLHILCGSQLPLSPDELSDDYYVPTLKLLTIICYNLTRTVLASFCVHCKL